jgi:hypothetical protein
MKISLNSVCACGPLETACGACRASASAAVLQSTLALEFAPAYWLKAAAQLRTGVILLTRIVA